MYQQQKGLDVRIGQKLDIPHFKTIYTNTNYVSTSLR